MIGIALSVGSACLSSAKDLCSKRISTSLGGAYSAYTSFTYAIPFYLVVLSIAYLFGWEDLAASPLFFVYVGLRSLTDSVAEWSKMHALELSDISYISNFLALSPIFLLITSPLITGDTIGVFGIVGVVIIVLSALLLSERKRLLPQDEENRKKAIVFAVVSAMAFSLNTCFDRLAVQQASPLFSGFVVTVLAALIIAPFVSRSERRKRFSTEEEALLYTRGGLELGFMVSKLAALTYLAPQYVAALGRLSLLLSVTGGRVFFQEKNYLRRLASALGIVFGAVVVIFDSLQ